MSRILAISAKSSTGCDTSSRNGGLMLLMSSRFGFGPMKDTSDITICSRIGSIDGLVTCANSWRKYWYSDLFLSDSTASGESLPIAPIASSPACAIGSSWNFRSSCE